MKRKYEVAKVEATKHGLQALVHVHEIGAMWGFVVTIPWELLADHKTYDEVCRGVDAWQRWEYSKGILEWQEGLF